jgi:hypothetical protein
VKVSTHFSVVQTVVLTSTLDVKEDGVIGFPSLPEWLRHSYY